MSFIITLLAAVLVFSAVIAIHEFGHFAVAKLCRVQVNEFSIGMGPVLLKKTQNGTRYSLRALPVGGFVALEGEESRRRKGSVPMRNPRRPLRALTRTVPRMEEPGTRKHRRSLSASR